MSDTVANKDDDNSATKIIESVQVETPTESIKADEVKSDEVKCK
jgi:hypothetical protein